MRYSPSRESSHHEQTSRSRGFTTTTLDRKSFPGSRMRSTTVAPCDRGRAVGNATVWVMDTAQRRIAKYAQIVRASRSARPTG